MQGSQARQAFDIDGKWLLENFGVSIIQLAAKVRPRRVLARAAQLVQQTQLPDGLLDVYFPGKTEPAPFLVELATRFEPRIVDQMSDDLSLAHKCLGKLPDGFVIILDPKAPLNAPTRFATASEYQLSTMGVTWTVFYARDFDADELIRTGDPGMAPWATLGKTAKEPEVLVDELRELIHEKSTGNKRKNLLCGAAVFASMRYNDAIWERFFLGSESMLEFPMVQKIKALGYAEGEAKGEALGEATALRESILTFARFRFHHLPRRVATRLKEIAEPARLRQILKSVESAESADDWLKHLD